MLPPAPDLSVPALDAAHRRDRRALEVCRSELARAQADLAALRSRMDARQRKVSQLASELEMYRRWAGERWWRRPRFDRPNVAPDLGLVFQQLRDDSRIFNPDLRGFYLQPGEDLGTVPFVGYWIKPRRPGLTGLLLAPALDVRHTGGRLGIEIVSPDNRIVAQAITPLSTLPEAGPVCLKFGALPDSGVGRFALRVFVREAASPLRLFEWRKYHLGGLGPMARRAFCGFLFEG